MTSINRKNKAINDKSVVDTAFKTLCFVLKQRKLYPLFRSKINHHDPNNLFMRYIVSLPNVQIRDENPFIKTKDRWDIYAVLFVNGMTKITEECCSTKTIQMRIADTINIILHHCIEPYFSPQTAESIGREAFNLTCKEIFGENFVDVTEDMNDGEKPNLTVEAFRKKLNAMQENHNDDMDWLFKIYEAQNLDISTLNKYKHVRHYGN